MDEREKFYIEQKVKLNTEIIKILAVIEVATITGVISLILSGVSFEATANLLLLVFGVIIIIVLFNLLILVYRDNVTLINNARIGR